MVFHTPPRAPCDGINVAVPVGVDFPHGLWVETTSRLSPPLCLAHPHRMLLVKFCLAVVCVASCVGSGPWPLLEATIHPAKEPGEKGVVEPRTGPKGERFSPMARFRA